MIGVRGFLLGARLGEGRQWARDRSQEILFQRNQKTQLTIWGSGNSGDSEIHDYANKEWAGLMGRYYLPR